MEGRWAQLTIDAHIAHAIDYRRPVKPFVEDAVLDRMEVLRELERVQLYPVVTEDGGQQMPLQGWADDFVAHRLLPWKHQAAATAAPVTIQDRIKQLQQIQRQK